MNRREGERGCPGRMCTAVWTAHPSGQLPGQTHKAWGTDVSTGHGAQRRRRDAAPRVGKVLPLRGTDPERQQSGGVRGSGAHSSDFAPTTPPTPGSVDWESLHLPGLQFPGATEG